MGAKGANEHRRADGHVRAEERPLKEGRSHSEARLGSEAAETADLMPTFAASSHASARADQSFPPTPEEDSSCCSCAEQHANEPGYHSSKEAYLRRLRRIEGQVRGLQRMVEDDVYCIDVLTQVSAVKKALEAVSLGLVEDHVRHCVRDAVADGSPATIDSKLDEVLAAMKRLM